MSDTRQTFTPIRQRPVRADSSTGLKGVSPIPNSTRFAAQITSTEGPFNLGSYATAEEAARAYDAAARYHYGEVAITNFGGDEKMHVLEVRRRYEESRPVPLSSYTGVHYHKYTESWHSTLKTEGGAIHLGVFDTAEAAARAWDGAVLYLGLQRPLNFPDSVAKAPPPKRQSSERTSKYRGLVFQKKLARWMAKFNVGAKTIYMGTFDDEEEAARAYDGGVLYLGLDRPLNFEDSVALAPPEGYKKKSRYKGVNPEREKFLARAVIRGKTVLNQRFSDELEAAKAYDRAILEHGGNPKRLNFPKVH